jgi:NAD(P) transhydrogenase subunit alpha
MAPGSVIVDLAAERGGNCDLTKAGEVVEAHGVKILGPINIPASIPYHASQMYARNVTTFLQNMIKDGELNIDMEDEIIRDTLITRDGDVVNARVREILGLVTSEAS